MDITTMAPFIGFRIFDVWFVEKTSKHSEMQPGEALKSSFMRDSVEVTRLAS